jgi:hypothetical protein
MELITALKWAPLVALMPSAVATDTALLAVSYYGIRYRRGLFAGVKAAAVAVGLRLLWKSWKWFRRERLARRLLEEFHVHDDSFASELDKAREAVTPVVEPLLEEEAPKRPAITRWVRGRKRGLAYGLAEEAYYQFGHRPFSEANVLITRKYMRDLLKEHKDLRPKDAAEIIDRALHLSFLPTKQLVAMSIISETYTYVDRGTVGPQSWIGWLLGRLRPPSRQ